MPTGKGTATLRVGLTSIKPGDGAVVAMYGGADYQKEQFNTATQATMQAGSTFKVFTLLAALSQDKPISTKTKFDGRSPQYFKEFEDKAAKRLPARVVRNFGRRRAVRQHRPAHGHRSLGQHRLRPAQHQGRRRQGTRDAAVAAGLPANRAWAPTTPTSSAPRTRDGDGHGQRLRDDRVQGARG